MRAQPPPGGIGSQQMSEEQLVARDPTPSSPGDPTTRDESLPRTFGRYELRQLLGKGGMGVVYLAYDFQLERRVALKIPRLLADESSLCRERFLVEARAAATLSHPNICPVYDVGEIDGQPYLTMAYIEGETVDMKLKREGMFAPHNAVELVYTVAKAIGEAHQRGIIHRDLKPANLMLDSGGRVVVMDFGLAIRSTASDDLRLTLSGVALGTPTYMSPEQAGGDHDVLGPASDVYSLGIILFELVTGRVPFQAKTFGKLLAQIERDPPPKPSSLNPEINPALDALILTAVAKKPADRMASASELAEALVRYQQGDHERLSAQFDRPYEVPGITTEHYPSPVFSEERKQPSWFRRGMLGLVSAAAVLLVTLCGMVIYVKTDYGQLVVHLKDPGAKVDVHVNGQEITLRAKGGKPIQVHAGKNNKLVVSGPDYETVSESFDMKRGGVHVARITLIPRGNQPPKSKTRPEIPPPPNKEKPKTTEHPKPPNLVQKPTAPPKDLTILKQDGWETILGVNKEQMQKWLDERKKAKHSVIWLDVCAVKGKHLHCAIAALDDRQPNWKALLDVPVFDLNPRKMTKQVNVLKNRIVAIAGAMRGLSPFYAVLFHPGEEVWQLGPAYDSTVLPKAIEGYAKRGYHVRILRGFPARGTRFHTTIAEAIEGEKTISQFAMSAVELEAFLKQKDKKVFRPNGISATAVAKELEFTAVLVPNSTGNQWEAQWNLTSPALATKNAAMAKMGFHPASVTGFAQEDTLRFCVVWNRRKGKQKKP